jgi:phage repressor protein C with HTH and peptisase S24 domain
MPPASSGGSSDGLVAVVARGDSMAGQIEDGWTVYYDKNHPQQPEQLIGKLCVVQVRGGPVLIKKVLPGRRPDVFTLISLNASPMLDQVIDWASRVSWIAPN